MVLQKNVLFSGTIKENLRWGNSNATDEELVKVCKLSMADDFIMNLPNKYDTILEQGGEYKWLIRTRKRIIEIIIIMMKILIQNLENKEKKFAYYVMTRILY